MLLRKIQFLTSTKNWKRQEKWLSKEQPFDLVGWIQRKKMWKAQRYLCTMLRKKNSILKYSYNSSRKNLIKVITLQRFPSHQPDWNTLICAYSYMICDMELTLVDFTRKLSKQEQFLASAEVFDQLRLQRHPLPYHTMAVLRSLNMDFYHHNSLPANTARLTTHRSLQHI